MSQLSVSRCAETKADKISFIFQQLNLIDEFSVFDNIALPLRGQIANPVILLVDEPTGNLDLKHGKIIMDMLTQMNQEGTTICMDRKNGCKKMDSSFRDLPV